MPENIRDPESSNKSESVQNQNPTEAGKNRQNETPQNMQSASPGSDVPGQQPPPEGKPGARGTAAMDPATRKEVARKGGLAVSRNKQHMADIGRKGGQSVSKNREHMAKIGRKGGAASRGHRQ